MLRTFQTLTLLTALLLAAACGDDQTQSPAPADDTVNNGGKTDDVGENSVVKALEGRQDPVADWLRTAANDDGTVPGSYKEVLDGMAQVTGCDRDSQRTYTILLTRAGHFPRNIMTLCSDNPQEASKFFLTTQSDNLLDDIDPRNLKLVGWDSAARVYRLYELTPNEADPQTMRLEIDPPKCRSCHAGPADLDNTQVPFAPIMNELVNPWTLWNAEPDFRSHQFDDTIDPVIAQAPIYKEMTAEGVLDSASNFEKHARAAFDRVTGARLRARRNDANIDEAMALLRPMFCDETLNYVSENHFTGETAASVVIDDSIRRLYLQIRPDNWPWDWLNDGVLRLSVPKADEEPIAVMPVRGENTLQLEISLVSRRVLTVEQVLQVRALDWRRPTMSSFRCNLFKQAEARLSVNPPDISTYNRNSDLIPALYEEIMQVEVFDEATGTTERVALISEYEGEVIAIADVEDPDAAYALDVGRWEDYETSLDGFGEQLETYFQALQEPDQRPILEVMRHERGCEARTRFSAAPHIPGTESCP